MMELFALWPFMLVALFGAFAHIIGKFAELEQQKRRFNPKTWMKKHRWRTLLGLMLTIAAVIGLHYNSVLTFPAVFAIGYGMDSLAKKGQKED